MHHAALDPLGIRRALLIIGEMPLDGGRGKLKFARRRIEGILFGIIEEL